MKSELSSLDFVINRFFMKMFNTNDMHIVRHCHNKLLRILQGKDRRSPTVELYLTYNTLPVLQQHDLQILLFVHKCLHHAIALPLLFSNYFSMNNVVHDHKTRQSNLLHLHSSVG